MKIINKILAAICLLAVAEAVLSAASGNNAEAEYRKLSKSWTLNPDGSQEFRYSMELTLFTHTAMNSTYGESFIVYNPEYQTLKVNSSYTVQKDGTVIETPSNAFVEVLPGAAANAPAYNGLKEMVIVHTGLELGATIYLDYTLTSKPGYTPELDIYDMVGQSSPVKEYMISVSVPESQNLNFNLYGMNARPVTSAASGMKTYKWTLRNVKAASRLQDIYHFDAPYFAANTYDSSENMAGTLSAQLCDGKNDSAIRSLAGSVAGENLTDAEKLKAICSHIQDNYVEIPLDLAVCGYRIRPADEVMNSAYGTAAELVNVFQGLLNASGLDTDVYAVFPRRDIKGLGLDNVELYVKVRADGKDYLLAPTSADTRSVVLQRQYCPALNLSSGKVEAPEPKDAAIMYTADLTVSGDTVTAECWSSVSDFYQALAGGPDGIPGSSSFECEVPVEKAGQYLIIHLPDCPFSVVQDPLTSGSRRNIMLTLLAVCDESYTYRIHLGDRTLCTPEKEVTAENSAGRLEISVRMDGGDAVAERVLRLSKPQISPGEYADYLELMRIWSDHNHTSVLVK